MARIDLGAPDFRDQDIHRQPPNSAFVVGAWSALPVVDPRVRGALARTEGELGEADAFALYLKDALDDNRRYYPLLSTVDNFTVPTHAHEDVPRGLIAVIDGGGAEIWTGEKGDSGGLVFAGSLAAVELLAEPAGDVVVDIWKSSYADFPPSVSDSICGVSKPTLSSGIKYRDTTLTGWDVTVAVGDSFRFVIDTVSLIEKLTITLTILGDMG